MTAEQNPRRLRLRPHSILCAQFLELETPDQGEALRTLAHQIREQLRSGTDTLIEVVEDIDDMCQACSLFKDGRCQNPQGNENESRKWDFAVLRDLGMSYGDKLTAGAFWTLIHEKAPLPLCRTRCQFRSHCKVFSLR
ncbi:MAG: DUF1284 domain-containing protein [Chloroflexi bacterium]|nr:DUF1284 domain-containing protein [Chloroflexota bacterium]